MMEKLLAVVIATYKDLYNLEPLNINKISEERIDVVFQDEVIKLDHTVGNKYRLWFDSFEGTIDQFRVKYDEIRNVNYIYCDTGYFLDLTESFIRDYAKYYKIK